VRIERSAEIEVARPPTEVFDFATACETFPRVLHRFGPLPGITGAEMQGGAAPKPGALRDIHRTDGSTVEEELLAYDRPVCHRYRWTRPPAPPLGWLVRGGEGEWRFAPSPRGTRIVWRYRFELSSVLLAPLALPIVALFRRWMARGLTQVREQMEAVTAVSKGR
jgi:hypothetical protein